MLGNLNKLFGGSSETKDSDVNRLREPRIFSSTPPKRGQVKTIAFHLPQFYEFELNNNWWGKGFTEWTNVVKAESQYPGHQQPHLPYDSGFYDLNNKETISRQVDLARAAGIDGFCFYYYNLSGNKLLREPVDLFCEVSTGMGFCFCWANENWTRRWDGQEQDVLLAQDYSDESIIELAADLSKYARHPDYIRINEKPLIIIYNPEHIPQLAERMELLGKKIAEFSGDKPFLSYVWRGEEVEQYNGIFKSATSFPLHYPIYSKTKRSHTKGKETFSYREMLRNSMKTAFPRADVWKCSIPSWDNTARWGERGYIFDGQNPKYFGSWYHQTKKVAASQNHSFVFINAWNEWAEGNHLEPDSKYGYANLNRIWIEQTIRSYDLRIALVIHVFYLDVFEEMLEKLWYLPFQYDLIITHPEGIGSLINEQLAKFPTISNTELIEVANRGRDILPFLSIGDRLVAYDLVCKLHTKKSDYSIALKDWGKYLVDQLIGELNYFKNISSFVEDHKLAVISPDWYDAYPGEKYDWGSNRSAAQEMLGEMQLDLNCPEEITFPAGSMFWFSPKVLMPAFNKLKLEKFEQEAGQLDGTRAHAIERIVHLVAQKQGYDVRFTSETDLPSIDVKDKMSIQKFHLLDNGLGAEIVHQLIPAKSDHAIDKLELKSFSSDSWSGLRHPDILVLIHPRMLSILDKHSAKTYLKVLNSITDKVIGDLVEKKVAVYFLEDEWKLFDKHLFARFDLRMDLTLIKRIKRNKWRSRISTRKYPDHQSKYKNLKEKEFYKLF